MSTTGAPCFNLPYFQSCTLAPSTWEAVEHCGFALQFVPEKLRADVEIALKAVRSWGWWFVVGGCGKSLLSCLSEVCPSQIIREDLDLGERNIEHRTIGQF